MNTWSELSDVQPLASKIMANSIKRGRISHAYLIQGLRGTGKKSLTTLFIKTLLCRSKDDLEPCHQCDICNRIKSKNHPDVYWVEPDGQSIRNEQIDDLRKEFSYNALESNRKIYIISHAETLTVNAANRLLKFLEEPTTKVTAILLTENKQAVIPTIRSRCQEFDLKPLNQTEFRTRLEHLNISEDHARLLSALTNDLDEAIQINEEKKIYDIQQLIIQLINTIVNSYEARYLFIHQQWLTTLKERDDLEIGIQMLIIAFKDILYANINMMELMTFFNREDKVLKQSINYFSQKRLLHILNILSSAEQKLKQHIHPTLVMEQLVLQV